VNSHFGTLRRKSPLPTRNYDNLLRGSALQHEYRGHRISLIMAERWTAELVELATGALLPTKLTADDDESFHALSTRARKLVDLYLDVETTAVRVLGPARPWQTILSQSPSARRL
jgi:hypothetical protein